LIDDEGLEVVRNRAQGAAPGFHSWILAQKVCSSARLGVIPCKP
jgi:hypothetical protein